MGDTLGPGTAEREARRTVLHCDSPQMTDTARNSPVANHGTSPATDTVPDSVICSHTEPSTGISRMTVRSRFYPLGGIAVLASLGVLVALTSTVAPGFLTRVTGSWVTGLQHLVYRLPGSSLTGALCVAGYVREAPRAIEHERECVRAERDAFREFAATVEAMTVPDHQSSGVTAARLVEPNAGDDSLRTVRDCYRDTVMSVPDYQQQYGERLEEHMTAELGDDLTTAVVGGDGLTDQLRRLLVSRARAAAQQRETFLETLDDEYESVTDGYARLQTTTTTLDETAGSELEQRSFSELTGYENDLRHDIDRHEQLLADRQQEVHRENRTFRRSEQMLLQEYLYADLPVTFPILDATLERLGRLRDRQRAVSRAIAHRH
jgi:hypothetical protein